MTYRVIQWATGSVGVVSLRAIIEHPELELAGVLVNNPEKDGADAGTLCGLAPTGVLATCDIDAILALDADCVSHSPRNTRETTDELARILESGKNVVTSVLVPALYPPAQHVSRRSTDRLALACQAGDVSCFVSGIDPGFATDALAVFLAQVSGRIDQIRMIEIFSYVHYDDDDTLFRYMGFGQPPDSEIPPYMQPGRLTRYWGPTVELVAAGLGVEVDEIREVTERTITDADLHVDVGEIEAGTIGALRFEIQGMVDGKPLVVLEHVTRMHPSVAPDWPQPTVPDGCYRIIISGWPNYELNLHASDEAGNEYLGMEAATGLRLVNLIPAVVDAKPGLLSPFDLGLPKATGHVRRVPDHGAKRASP